MIFLLLHIATALNFVPYVSKFEDILAPHDVLVLNNTPIIGVITLPGSELGTTYVNSEIVYGSIVDFLIVGGARVVPISYQTDLANPILGYINGIVIQHNIHTPFIANNNLTDYGSKVQNIVSILLYMNQLPTLGMGEGFDMIAYLINRSNLMTACPSCNSNGSFFKLNMIKDITVKLLSYVNPEVLRSMTDNEYTYGNYKNVLRVKDLIDAKSEIMNYAATTFLQGVEDEVVTILESPVYPVFATKFLPFMGNYLFYDNIPAELHNANTVKFSQSIANYL